MTSHPRPNRRSVVLGGAWAVPTVLVAGAAPAHAASIPLLSAAYNGDSFRSNNNAGLESGSTARDQLGALAITITVSGGSVSSLTCTLTTTGPVTLANNTATPRRGGTVWLPRNGALAADGWGPSPAIGTSASEFTFTRGATSGTVPLRVVIFDIASTDFPFTFRVTAPGAATPASVIMTDNVLAPFVSGAPL